MSSTVKTDRFYCQVKDGQLYIHPSLKKKQPIGKLNPSQHVYTINNAPSRTLAVKGQISVKNKKWEFTPQKAHPIIGPSRVQVIID